jgi:hypothetical protein
VIKTCEGERKGGNLRRRRNIGNIETTIESQRSNRDRGASSFHGDLSLGSCWPERSIAR